MTIKLKTIIKNINEEFVKNFQNDHNVESILIMKNLTDNDNQYNHYFIKVICKEITCDKLLKFEKFLNDLSTKLTTNNFEVRYEFLEGPISYQIKKFQNTILIHAMIYTINQIKNISPLIYKDNYYVIYGEDILKKYRNDNYNQDYCLTIQEGINDCINTLKEEKYKNLRWNVDKEKCNLLFKVEKISSINEFEVCSCYINNIIINIMNYCKAINLDIPDNKVIFCIRLLGREYITEKTLFLLQGVINKDENLVRAIFSDLLYETINLLEQINLSILNLENIFIKQEKAKVKSMIRN